MKAVVFDVGGVLVSAPQLAIACYEESLNLPRGMIPATLMHNAPHNAFCRLEIGELTLSEFLPLFEEECHSTAGMFHVNLPDTFSAKALFDKISDSAVFEHRMFQAAMKLKKNGYQVGVLTNNWIDVANEQRTEEFFSFLNHHFHAVIESCKVGVRKPDQAAFKIACERLKTDPHKVIFLDDLGVNVKAARQLGMHTILVKDISTALKQLSKATGVNVHSENIKSKI